MRKALRIAGIAAACIAAVPIIGELLILACSLGRIILDGIDWAWSGVDGFEAALIRACAVGFIASLALAGVVSIRFCDRDWKR